MSSFGTTDNWDDDQLSDLSIEAIRVMSLANASFNGVLLVVYAFGYLACIDRLRYRVSSKTWFVALYLAIFCAFGEGVSGILANFSSDSAMCHWGMIAASFCYASMNWFLYVFLYLRSKLMEFNRNRYFGYFEKGLVLLMTAYLFLSPLVFIDFAGFQLSVEDGEGSEVCVMYVASYLTKIGLGFDLVLSLGFLFLFIYPFWEMRSIANDRIKRRMRENLILSTVMIVSTSITMIGFSFYALTPDRSTRVATFTHFDAMLNITCACVLTRFRWKDSLAGKSDQQGSSRASRSTPRSTRRSESRKISNVPEIEIPQFI